MGCSIQPTAIFNQSQSKTNNMKKSIQLSDFNFKFAGYGHYQVTYTSPVTLKSFTITTNNMSIIDDTKNADEPKKSDLLQLKKICKSK